MRRRQQPAHIGSASSDQRLRGPDWTPLGRLNRRLKELSASIPAPSDFFHVRNARVAKLPVQVLLPTTVLIYMLGVGSMVLAMRYEIQHAPPKQVVGAINRGQACSSLAPVTFVGGLPHTNDNINNPPPVWSQSKISLVVSDEASCLHFIRYRDPCRLPRASYVAAGAHNYTYVWVKWVVGNITAHLSNAEGNHIVVGSAAEDYFYAAQSQLMYFVGAMRTDPEDVDVQRAMSVAAVELCRGNYTDVCAAFSSARYNPPYLCATESVTPQWLNSVDECTGIMQTLTLLLSVGLSWAISVPCRRR